ncbi:hypothetical protein PAMA_003229 [Pampus argenteus]
MDFQKLLLDAGKALSKDDVKALVFLCTDLIGRSPTSVKLASELFSCLEDQDYLSPERPQLLTELLLTIHRPRLVRDLGLNEPVSTTRSLISPYRKLLYNLSDDFTDNDLKQMKFLLNKEIPRRKLDDSVTTLEVFLEMEHMDHISSTNLSLLKSIIESVCPVLKEKINQFEATQERHTGCIAQDASQPMSVSFPFEENQPSMILSGPAVDFPRVLCGGDDDEDLSHRLSELTIETNNLRTDAVEMLPSQEDRTVGPAQFQTTNTNNEVLGTYPMTSEKRGICLIVNNYDFTESKKTLKKREGTMVDERNLHAVFEWLGFETEIQKDCKREEMLSVIRELASKNHSQMDCLVCCVLSHGLEQGVYGVDGLTVELQELMEPFTGSQCSSLAKKPKLFFIQACQGTREQEPVYIEADGPTEGSVCSDAQLASETIPSAADFLLGVATVPSFVSFRQRKHGTWYIQSLCQNLVQMVPRGFDLVSIMTKVNADVSRRTDCTGEKKQMPQPAFTLTNKVVFPIPRVSPPNLQH